MQLPQHIGIIMDGNGRCKAEKMPVSYGHKCGADAYSDFN